MTQRLCSQLSLKRSFSLAVSILALIIGFLDLGMVKPQTIGNKAPLPDFEVAITGTMSVGLISPSVINGRESAMVIGLVKGDFSAISTYFLRSGDDFSRKNLQHMVEPVYHAEMNLLSCLLSHFVEKSVK